jgi:hypothetical protein
MTNPYIMPIPASQMFIDLSYQRDPQDDSARIKKIAAEWDPKLVGVVEVSDRGDTAAPRYAVLDGGHRLSAAQLLDTTPVLVANVHEHLTVQQEAALYARLNIERRQLTTWDRWRARRAAGDPIVAGIDKVVQAKGMKVMDSPVDGVIRCPATLEAIAASEGGLDLLDATLSVLYAAWRLELEAYDRSLVAGAAALIHELGDRLDGDRLVSALGNKDPKRIRYHATQLRDTGGPHGTGVAGSIGKLVAMVMLGHYNKAATSGRLGFSAKWTGRLAKAKDRA